MITVNEWELLYTLNLYNQTERHSTCDWLDSVQTPVPLVVVWSSENRTLLVDAEIEIVDGKNTPH